MSNITESPATQSATIQSGTLSPSAPKTLENYYRVLVGGADAFAQGEGMRLLLSEHLDFTGSLAGHIPDATDGFLQGVSGFVSTVNHIGIVQEVHDARGSAVLYDADLPGGTVRFAEFFVIRDGVIDAINLHYDGQDYIAKGGQ